LAAKTNKGRRAKAGQGRESNGSIVISGSPDLECEASEAMLRLLVSLVLVLVGGSLTGAVPQGGETTTTESPSSLYWWLGLDPSPFGGKNYNFDEVQRGEHIKKAKGSVRLKGDSAQRGVKKISKRDAGADYDEDEYYSDDEYEYDYEEESDYDQEAEEEYYYDNDEEREGFPFGLLEEDKDGGGVISFNDIETECPAATICVERFFCAEFSGNSVSDQIPCLITSGPFTGDFGICCNRRHPRVCPEVRSRPKPEHCAPRPLGDPPDEECPSDGVSSFCPPGSLCCFNGCINVCLEDPPHSVQTAFWRRRMGFEVNREPKEESKKPQKQPKSKKRGPKIAPEDFYDYEGGAKKRAPKSLPEEYYDYEDEYKEEYNEDYSGDYVYETPKSEREERAETALLKLISLIRSRISS